MNTFTTSLSPQNDDIIFNLQSSDLNFDPVINFGRVKGSFTDKFMRLAESSMATTYNYNHDSQLNANEQDLTDTSFWQGLIGQMIIPELTDGAKDEINNLLTALADFDENMSKEEPDDNEDLISEITTPYGNLKDLSPSLLSDITRWKPWLQTSPIFYLMAIFSSVLSNASLMK